MTKFKDLITKEYPKAISSTLICLPFLGSMRITSLFGPRKLAMENYVSRKHLGLDIVGVGDTTVVSISSGTVKKVQPQSDGSSFGNRVWVLNDDNKSVVYAHLKSFLCEPGQRVSAKTPIGIMGNTGKSTGAHTHIGIFRNNKCSAVEADAVDPAYYLNLNDIKVGSYYNGTGYVSSTMLSYDSLSDLENGNPNNTSTEYNAVLSNLEISESYYKVIEGSEELGDSLYGRRYRIIISTENGEGIDVSALRCKFKLIKSWTNSTETSELTIYNLSAEHENKILNKAKIVFVEAGYVGKQSYGLIYKGSVIQTLRSKDAGVDYKITLIMGDATVFNANAVLGVSVNSQNNMRKVISEVVNKSGNLTNTNYGMSLGDITNRSDELTLPRGKVLFGNSSKILNQIANSLGSTVYIEDGTVNFVTLETEDENVIFDIGPTSGMIGTPTQASDRITVKCLLNPKFKLNTLFHLDNSYVQTHRYSVGEPFIPLDTEGIYRIIKITHSGDTRGNDWFTEVDALNQVGKLPAISSNGFSNVL